jgi:hypothetical protein
MALTTILPSGLNSANDFSSLVPSAYAAANAAFVQANAAFLQANNSTDTWVRTQANNAYDTANSAASFANGAFTKANNALPLSGGTLTGNLTVNANTTVNGALIIIGTGSAANAITFADGTLQYTANTDPWARAQANAAFSQANNSTDTWVRTQANNAYNTANSAGSFANGAFTKANNALANTSGATFNGILNVTGTLRALSQGGDEGGEIFLDKAGSNTTLAAGVTIDIYQNKLRIFETGGSVRGAFIDLSAAGAGVSSDLLGGGGGGTTDTTARVSAQAAFDTANSAGSFANGAFLTANSGASFANAAYAHANAAYAAANTGGGGGGGADTWARAQANAAFLKANTEILIFAVTDDTSNVTVGASRTSFRAPSAMTLTSIPRASLNVASTSGLVTCDIKLNGTTILGANKLSIDATEKTSTTAATPTTLATTAISDDAEISVDITAAGTGAKGLKITLYYTD